MHGKLRCDGRQKSPDSTAVRNAGTVGARNGILPTIIK